MNIKAGDYLLAIDGTPLQEGVNPDSLLVDKAGANVALTIHAEPALDGRENGEACSAAAFSEAMWRSSSLQRLGFEAIWKK